VSEARRQTRIVYEGFMELAGSNDGVVEVGDIATYMRVRNRPMGGWEIRGELSRLRALGLVEGGPGGGVQEGCMKKMRGHEGVGFFFFKQKTAYEILA